MILRLIYDGKALDNNEISPKDLSVAVLSLDLLLEEANSVLNDNRAKIQVKVKASFETGCFKINFAVIQSLSDKIKDLYTTIEPIIEAKEIAGLVFGATASLVALLKFLKGLPPQRIFENENGNFVVVCCKKEFKTEKKVIQLYQSFKLRQQFEQLTSPLLREGVEDVAIKLDDNKTNFCQITKEELNYFKCLASREIKLDEEPVIFKTSINIINLSFKEDNKWYVNDGQSSFYVLVEDDDFLSDINAGKEFAKGDILKVRIKREQFYNQDEKKLKTEHFIEEVLEHVKPQRHLQGNLF